MTTGQMYGKAPKPTKTGGAGGQLAMLKNAAGRRLYSNTRPGGGPSGGKKQLSPYNGKSAGSLIPNNKHNGIYSTFIKENWSKRTKG